MYNNKKKCDITQEQKVLSFLSGSEREFQQHIDISLVF
jgi:hypothetical protein